MPYLITGLMEILLDIRPWPLLYGLKSSWSYGNITREDHDVFCMPYLITGLMEMLLERRPWRLLYALLNLITGLMEILLEIYRI